LRRPNSPYRKRGRRARRKEYGGSEAGHDRYDIGKGLAHLGGEGVVASRAPVALRAMRPSSTRGGTHDCRYELPGTTLAGAGSDDAWSGRCLVGGYRSACLARRFWLWNYLQRGQRSPPASAADNVLRGYGTSLSRSKARVDVARRRCSRTRRTKRFGAAVGYGRAPVPAPASLHSGQ